MSFRLPVSCSRRLLLSEVCRQILVSIAQVCAFFHGKHRRTVQGAESSTKTPAPVALFFVAPAHVSGGTTNVVAREGPTRADISDPVRVVSPGHRIMATRRPLGQRISTGSPDRGAAPHRDSATTASWAPFGHHLGAHPAPTRTVLARPPPVSAGENAQPCHASLGGAAVGGVGAPPTANTTPVIRVPGSPVGGVAELRLGPTRTRLDQQLRRLPPTPPKNGDPPFPGGGLPRAVRPRPVAWTPATRPKGRNPRTRSGSTPTDAHHRQPALPRLSATMTGCSSPLPCQPDRCSVRKADSSTSSTNTAESGRHDR